MSEEQTTKALTSFTDTEGKPVSQATAKRMLHFLKALERSRGVVSTAADKANVSRRVVYRWLERSPSFRERFSDVQEAALDFTESKLYELIEQGNVAATIFALKCKGKKRGWVERSEVIYNLSDMSEAELDLIIKANLKR